MSFGCVIGIEKRSYSMEPFTCRSVPVPDCLAILPSGCLGVPRPTTSPICLDVSCNNVAVPNYTCVLLPQIVNWEEYISFYLVMLQIKFDWFALLSQFNNTSNFLYLEGNIKIMKMVTMNSNKSRLMNFALYKSLYSILLALLFKNII